MDEASFVEVLNEFDRVMDGVLDIVPQRDAPMTAACVPYLSRRPGPAIGSFTALDRPETGPRPAERAMKSPLSCRYTLTR